MQYFGLSDVGVFAALLVASFVIFYPQNRAFRRRGIDPGVLSLKIWPARIWFLLKGHDITQKAYREAKNVPYLLQTLVDDVLVLPPRFLPELQLQPGTKLSASHALVASVLGQYSGVDVILKDRQANDISRTQLTKSLPAIIPPIAEKVESILLEKLSQSFTPIKVQDLVAETVLRTTLLTFVGPDLAENAELQKAVTDFSNVVRDIAICLLLIPTFMRPWVYPILPPKFRMRRLHATVRRILFSTPESRNKDGGVPTMVRHFVATSKVFNEDEIVSKFLTLIAAALHTMTMSTVHALIDLCAYPQYIFDLRDEVCRSLSADNNDGTWGLDQIHRLKRFDAFLKESQRFNPPNYLSFDRMAMDSITLSDGTNICKGQLISMPAGPMAMDPEFHENPQSFDASRFLPHKTFLSDEKLTRDLEFVGIEKGNVHWGAGRFTCPGRWYASAVMKCIIGSILMKYDITFPEGQQERLPNVYLDIVIEPNPKQKVMFQPRD
ncbi:cytochrome P450 [Melanomma pulvis-pyrius CBS 109.77]|uniref:Cytochrome P450 n=1 Tax=Melanomma pulvis-pyrius CBS 109.77 TaxID=1314802 RepID=A0A6A6XK10_9PLEO|nr:cytochrome P450 [Melanomma pulvis-pyrius CBS 109.77]